MKHTRSIAAETALVVRSAIDNTAYLRPPYSAGTHGTRLHRDIKRTLRQVFTAQGIGGRRYRLHLGMGGDIVERLREVVGTRYDTPVAHYHRADGYLAGIAGCLGLGKGLAHEPLIPFLLFFGDIAALLWSSLFHHKVVFMQKYYFSLKDL